MFGPLSVSGVRFGLLLLAAVFQYTPHPTPTLLENYRTAIIIFVLIVGTTVGVLFVGYQLWRWITAE